MGMTRAASLRPHGPVALLPCTSMTPVGRSSTDERRLAPFIADGTFAEGVRRRRPLVIAERDRRESPPFAGRTGTAEPLGSSERSGAPTAR